MGTRCHPVNTGCLPLSHSGNPGGTDESDRGVTGKRLGGPDNAPCHVCGTYTVKVNVPMAAEWRLIAISRGETIAAAEGGSFMMRFVETSSLDKVDPAYSTASVGPGVVGTFNSFTIQGRTQPSKAGKDDSLDWTKGGYQVRVEVVTVAKLNRQALSFKASTTEVCTGDVMPHQYIWTTKPDSPQDPKSAEKNFVNEQQLKDNDDGTVTVTWSSSEVGEHRVVVLLVDDGNPMGSGTQFPIAQSQCIKGSPFIVNVTTADIFAGTTTASGPGLSSGNAGEELSFTVDSYDQFDNPRTFNPEQTGRQKDFTVELIPDPPNTPGGQKVVGVLEDLLDGSFRAVYQSSRAGQYKLEVQYDGAAIKSSPWDVIIDAGAVSTKHCTAQGAGLSFAKAGETAVFLISARDQFGNLNAKATEEAFAAKFSFVTVDETATSPRVSSSTEYQGAGVYITRYNATVSGNYNLQVTRGEQTIKSNTGSAFFPVTAVAGDTFAGSCVAAGLGLSGGTAGELQSFGIVSRDEFGNAITQGGDKFSVKVVLMVRPAEGGVEIKDDVPDLGTVTDVGDGSYTVVYRAILDGKYQLKVELEGGGAVRSSPFTNVILNKAKPPSFLSATFANTGGSIAVLFDGPTNKARMAARGPCDAVLDQVKTITLLGNSPSCFWRTPELLTIYLGNSFLIDRGIGKIALKEAALMTALENSEFAIGEQGPEFPSDPPVPQISVKAPTSVGVCQDVILDASGTTGTGGRPIAFKWGVQIGPPNASVVQQRTNEGDYYEWTKLDGNCDHEDPALVQNPALGTSAGTFTIPCPACENSLTGESNPMTQFECKKICAREPKCRGFNYRASGSGHCVLKRVTCQNSKPQVGSAAYFYHALDDSKVHIPYDLLSPGATYTFVLRCENWMGQISTWSGEVYKKSIAIPAITLLTGGSAEFPLEFRCDGVSLRNWLFTLELQWQSRGKCRFLQGLPCLTAAPPTRWRSPPPSRSPCASTPPASATPGPWRHATPRRCVIRPATPRTVYGIHKIFLRQSRIML